MAERNGLLNRRRGNLAGGSNPPLSAIFVPKNGERSRKASLHCAKHNFTQKAKPFLHIFTFPASLACLSRHSLRRRRMKRRSLRSLVKRSASRPVKFSPFWEQGWLPIAPQRGSAALKTVVLLTYCREKARKKFIQQPMPTIVGAQTDMR